MKSNLELIKEACIKANSKIRTEMSICPVCNGSGSRPPHDDFDIPCDFCPGSIGQLSGRPIRLADVLLALNEKEHSFMGDWVINTRGHFAKILINGQYISEAAVWNLLDDNLDHQSPETLDFIASLLK